MAVQQHDDGRVCRAGVQDVKEHVAATKMLHHKIIKPGTPLENEFRKLRGEGSLRSSLQT
ncbi:hypothetical protein [Mycobacterium lehmannii]|uniref:hypothetical protein n=1 Tax=Mycobacterium lehmannii TaxID=2048550 RepID=UPI0013F4FA48|nr:hypothetical protein [Mycobacterium lehmannii]